MPNDKITRVKPVVNTVRIRVQSMDGNKPLKTESITLYGANADEIFKLVSAWVDETVIGE